jgi:hypothetical protein
VCAVSSRMYGFATVLYGKRCSGSGKFVARKSDR